MKAALKVQARKYPIHIFYSEEDRGYIANVPDLEMCSAFGKTPQEALEQVMIAQQAWLESADAHGKPIPEPNSSSSRKVS